MSIRLCAIGYFVLTCAGTAIGQDFSSYVACNDSVLATTPVQAFLPGSPTYTMRISPVQGTFGVVASGANVQIWRLPCPAGGKTVTAVRIVPDAQQPPSDALGLRYYIVQANAPRQPAILNSYFSDVSGPTTGTLMFPPLSVSSPLPEQIDGDPDGAFTIEALDATNTLRGLINIPALSVVAQGFVPQVGLWWNPAESGTGYSLDSKHGVLVVTVYTYTADGQPMWYLASGPITNGAFVATMDKYAGGPCIACSFKANTFRGNDGTIVINFTSSTSANAILPDGRTIAIVPYAF
jgi:hypothetical protein